MAYFRKRDNGWEYRISYKTPDGKYKQKSKSGFRTKSEAQTAAAKEEIQLAQGVIEDKNITLYDYFTKWADVHKKESVSRDTFKSYTQTKNNIKLIFQDTKLSAITPTSYQQALNQLGETRAKGTVARFHTHVKAAVQYALHEGILSRDFCALAKVHSKKEGMNKQDKFLEINEFQFVIQQAKEKRAFASYLCIYMIAKTGMRFAEALGLTWEDIDTKEMTIRIDKTWDYFKNTGFKPTKTKAGNRIVPIDQDFLETISWDSSKTGRILPNLTNPSVNKSLRRLIDRNIHIHSLRHTYASFLITQGIEIITISEIMGHENIGITMKVYSHQLESLRSKNTEKVRQAFKNLGRVWGET